MKVYHTVWIAIGIGAMLIMFSSLWAEMGASGAADVQGQRHYRALLAPQPINIIDVIETAQQLDYWIRIQTEQNVTYLKGQTPCSACDPASEEAFFTPPQLYVDGQEFWIRLDEPDFRLNLRPSHEVPASYELIVSPKLPKVELDAEDLSAIGEALGPFGLLPAQTDSLSFEPLIPVAKPAPPEGVRLDSVLYGLMLAPDWTDYAHEREIELSGLRAVVLIELTSADAELPEGLDLVIEARSAQLVRAQALIHRLGELARQPTVAFVRLPSRPQPPGS